MTTVLLIVHLFVTLSLIGVVLIQRSEGGGLGIGTSQGMGGFMSGRGTANLLTRLTAILGTIFFLLSLALALLNRGTMGVGRSILDTPPAGVTSPAPVPPAIVPGGPAIPGAVPVPQAAVPSPAANAGPALSGSTLPTSPVPEPAPSPTATPAPPSATELAPTGPASAAPTVEPALPPNAVIPESPPAEPAPAR